MNTDYTNFFILAKKWKRNFIDYGFLITITKSIASIIQPLIEKKAYRIYVINPNNFVSNIKINRVYKIKNVSSSDTSYVEQIEEMEERLNNVLKKKLDQDSICIAALDGDIVAGFNLVSLEECHLPLVHYRRKLRSHEAWSEQITVNKNYRRKKVATMLRIEMIEFLKNKGITKFYGGTQVSNRASLNLTRSLGFMEIAEIRYLKVFVWEQRSCKRWKRES